MNLTLGDCAGAKFDNPTLETKLMNRMIEGVEEAKELAHEVSASLDDEIKRSKGQFRGFFLSTSLPS